MINCIESQREFNNHIYQKKKKSYSQIALFLEVFVLNSLIVLNNGDGNFTSRTT